MLPLRMLSLLMLMASLGSVNSMSPTDYGPFLKPQELIGSYGDKIPVNCSTDSETFDEIYLKIENKFYGKDEDLSFVFEEVSLSDWSMEAECILQLNGSEYSKKRQITVYQNPEVFLSVQDVNVSAEGTLYKLQCDVMNVAPVQNVTVTWYRNNTNITTTSFNDTTKTPVNVSSHILLLISREENVVQVECEAQLVFDRSQLPAVSQTQSISAIYSPEFILNHDDENFYVLEGDSISLNCDAEGNPPPVFNWSHDGVNVPEQTSSLQLNTIKSSSTYTCTASNHLGSTTKHFSIHVIRVTTPVTKSYTEPPSTTQRDCPITVMPSETVVKFGDPLSFNCTTSDTDVFAMSWNIKFDNTVLPPLTTWYVQKFEEWDLNLSCLVFWPDFQCEKGPNITVYQNPEVFLSVQDVSVSAEGTLYKLQCDVMNVAPVQNVTVTWYRNNTNITTTSFNDTTKTPVNVSSHILLLISREENVVQVECEAQLVFDRSQLPAVSQTQSISAMYSPEFILNHDDENFYVLEGDSISLNCDAEGNPPPVFNWSHDGVNVPEETSSLQLNTIKSSSTYTCTASNHLGSTTKHFSIHVIRVTTPVTKSYTEPPSTTQRDCPITVMPSETVVKFGDPLSINCTTSDTDVIIVGWTDSHGVTEINEPPSITWSVEQLKMWNLNMSCFVQWSEVQCEKRPTITVYQFPDMVSISTEQHGAMVEGKQQNLTCNIYNVAPVKKLRVIWYQGNKIVATDTFHDLLSVTPTNVSSTLKVTPKRNDSGSVFTCKAELDIKPKVHLKSIHSATSASHTAVVHYPPEFKEVTDNKEGIVGINVTFVCSAEGNPPPEIYWNYTSAVNLNETTVGRQKIINITRATSTNAGVYICVATNEVGSLTRSVTLVIKDANSSLHAFNFLWNNVYIFAAILILFIIILVIIVYQHISKHGQYNLVPHKAQDGSDIPMTPQCVGEKV